MTRPTCAGSDVEKYCERAVVRYRGGTGYCLFHPDSEPPALDPKTGQPVKTTPVKAAKDLKPAPYRAPGRVVEPDAVPEPTVTPEPTPAAAEADPDGMLELQAELDELERTDPAVTAAAASYDVMVDHVLSQPPPAETSPKTIPADVTPAPRERHRAVGDPCAADGRPAAEHAPPAPITETAVPQPETDLLTLQVAWSVAARYTSEGHSAPATRQVAREARRALGILIDQLKHDGVGAHPVEPKVATAHSGRDRELLCRKGCGKVCHGPQGLAGHERHCKHQAESA